MTLSAEQAGALAATVVLFVGLGLTHTKTIKRHPWLCTVAFVCGAVVALGLTVPAPGFAAAVARALGGATVALFILWGVEIYRLRRDLERRSATHRTLAFLGALAHAGSTGQNPHEYVDSLLRDGAIDEDEASVLHDQLLMLAGVPRP